MTLVGILHVLEVRAYDPFGRFCLVFITVTVLPSAPQGIPDLPLETIVLGLLVTLSLGVLIRRRRRQ
ncbi:MAG: hypothetical protein ACFFCF_12490 [Promethearchaeota archaeon]